MERSNEYFQSNFLELTNFKDKELYKPAFELPEISEIDANK